ncbi:MAG: helix-turn-helix domain-containing protein, partial [Desulfobacterales bacterium]|nr:helix-turn-helix domain-containing protein [Desulfobacterales bacterium]
MENKIKQQRLLAVQRFRNGESPNSICASLGKSKAWFYKWIERSLSGDDSWSKSQSRRPLSNPVRTPTEAEEVVKFVRLSLYNQDLFCGAQAIRWELEDLGVEPLPSIRTINRILSRNELT